MEVLFKPSLCRGSPPPIALTLKSPDFLHHHRCQNAKHQQPTRKKGRSSLCVCVFSLSLSLSLYGKSKIRSSLHECPMTSSLPRPPGGPHPPRRIHPTDHRGPWHGASVGVGRAPRRLLQVDGRPAGLWRFFQGVVPCLPKLFKSWKSVQPTGTGCSSSREQVGWRFGRCRWST